MTGNSAYDGYGVINKALWGHKAFRVMHEDSKLLFLYLIAGPETRPSGLFHVSMVAMGDLYGQDYLVDDCLSDLKSHGMIDYYVDKFTLVTVWVKGMMAAIKDADILLEARKQVLDMPRGGLVNGFIAYHGLRDDDAPVASQALLAAVAQATKKSVLLLNLEDVRKIDKLAKADITAEMVTECFAWPDGKWYKMDWRGQKGQKPTIKDIGAEVRHLLDGHAKASIDKQAVLDYVYRAQRNNYETMDVRPEVEERWGAGLWEAMKPWGTWKRLNKIDTKFKMYETINSLGE